MGPAPPLGRFPSLLSRLFMNGRLSETNMTEIPKPADRPMVPAEQALK